MIRGCGPGPVRGNRLDFRVEHPNPRPSLFRCTRVGVETDKVFSLSPETSDFGSLGSPVGVPKNRNFCVFGVE